MAIYDKVADLKNTFPRLVAIVQYMKKYYKFCNISFCRKQNTVYIFKLNHCVQMLIIAKAVLNFNPCSCFFNNILNHQSLVKQTFYEHQIVDKRLNLILLC